MPFQKGHQLSKGGNGGMRNTFTSELIQQLEEVMRYKHPRNSSVEELGRPALRPAPARAPPFFFRPSPPSIDHDNSFDIVLTILPHQPAPGPPAHDPQAAGAVLCTWTSLNGK